MAHMIDMSNGRANFAYIGKQAWHSLGEAMQSGASIEDWIKVAGLNYNVVRAIVEYAAPDGMHTFPGRDVLYRDDTGAPLGVVSDRYQIVQPRASVEFYEDLCASKGLTLETAGALMGGALYFATARTGHDFTLVNGDTTKAYLLFSSSADGSRATDVRFVSTRVVCNNTLSVALSEGAKHSARTKHSTMFSATATKQALGLIDFDSAWTKFRDDMRALADTSVSQDQASAFFADLLRPAADRAKARGSMGASSLAQLLGAPVGAGVNMATTDKAPVERAIRGFADLMQSYTTAPGAMPGTAYGLLQGVTHFVDHVRGIDDDKRAASAMFGQGDTMKQAAFDKALALVGA